MFESNTFNSMDEVQQAVFELVLSSGKYSAPRDVKTLETLAVSFSLSNPRNRCILNPERRWSLPLALGELAWHLSASDEAANLAYYAPIWSSFADEDGRIHGSCYGAKVFGGGDGSQWSEVRRLLSKDPDTRRAILYFSGAGASRSSKDLACATSLQFLLRENRLDAVVNMRSNDAVWGLPYDVFLFSFLQELMAVALGVELGHYHHFAASMHIYEKQIALCKRVLNSQTTQYGTMPEIDSLESLQGFLKREASIRCKGDIELPTNLTPFWTDLSRVLVVYRNLRDGVVSDVCRLELPEVYKDALFLVLSRQITVPSAVV